MVKTVYKGVLKESKQKFGRVGCRLSSSPYDVSDDGVEFYVDDASSISPFL